MDSTINGELSDESTDKEKSSSLSVKENKETLESSSVDNLKTNSVTVSEQIPVENNSENLPLDTSISEENVPQTNSSADNLTVKAITDDDECHNSVDSNIDIKLSDASPKNVHNDEDSIKSKENSTSETQNDSVCIPAMEMSSDSDLSKEPHKLQSSSTSHDCSLDLSVSPSVVKSKSFEDAPQSADSEEKMDTEENNLIPATPLPSVETAEKLSPEDGNKVSEVSDSKNSSNVCENLTEKILNCISNSLNTPPPAANNEHSDILSESKSSESHSAAVEKDVEKNESSPIEQLNQHLNSIGGTDEEIPECSVPKINAQDADESKTPSPKECQKNTAFDDRLKQSDSFVFTEISKEETGFPDAFTGLVVIGKYISVKGDFTLKSSEALMESPSLIAPYLLKEPDTFPPRLNDSKLEQRDFFHSTAGEMLIGIGLSRVSEWYHRDMTRIKKRQMKKEGKSPELEEDLKKHENFYNEARKANKIYSFSLKSCATCGFSTESSIVMEGHLLVPHINQKREYQCNFCDVFNRDPKAILEHMFRVHQKTGRIQPPTLFFECPYCSFESNSKVKLGNHFMKCQRFYDPNRNQAPPKDFEFPALTTKPITVAVVKSYEKSICSMQRGRGRPKKIDTLAEQLNMNQYTSNINHAPLISSHMPPYRPTSTSSISENLSSMTNQMISSMHMPNMGLRPHSNLGPMRPNLPPSMHLPSPNRFFQVVNSSTPLMPMLSNSPLVTTPSQFPYNTSLLNTNSVSKKVPTHSPQFLNSLFGGSLRQQNPPKSVPEVTLTPLPKLHGPYPVPVTKPSSKPSNNSSSSTSSLVVCEICDGYIKDLEQLRSHMQLIHKVKIHPKMLVSRPPLNCQKCQWRFFTDQGLERHLLGAHGLVTSNMQEQANKGKDAGCCTICGRVFASKLVSHMNQVHKLTLKPAHLSYKCTVCSATFNLYRLFENHVYLVHSGAAKRPSEGSSNSSKKLKSSSEYSDSHCEGGEPKNHSEKNAIEDVYSKCTGCGKDFRKHPLQADKCAKCLKSDVVSQGTVSSKAS